MKKQKTNTYLALGRIIIIMIIIFTTTLSYAQWSVDEGFENGIIPNDWTIYDVNGDGHQWYALNYPSHAHSGDWMAAVDCYGSNGNDWLITPQVTIQSGDSFIFWARAWYGTEDMNVKLSTTGNAISNFTVTLESVTGLGANYVEFTYDLSSYAGQSIYLAIQWVQETYGFVVDDVKVGQPEANDVGMLSIEVPETHHFINTEIYPSGTIKNYGTTEITDNFEINCEIVNESSVIVYNSTIIHTGTLSSQGTEVVTFDDSWTPTELGNYYVTMVTNLSGDANPNNDTITDETEIVMHYGIGGPDNFGYQWIDSEEPGGPVYNWIEISGTGTSAIMYGVNQFYGDYNFSEPIDFGFNFPFYGIDRTYCYIDINGEILLADNTWYNAYPNTGWGTDGNFFNYSFPIPGNTYMPALVAVYWDDLEAVQGVGDVYFQTFGVEPYRYFVVEWHNLKFRYGTVVDTTLSFEAIFHESGEMIFQYKTTAIGQTGSTCPHDNGRSSTVGIQNDDADIGLCYLREIVDNGQYIGVEPYGNLLQDELAIRFFAGPDDQPPYFVYKEIGNTFDNTPELSVEISDMSGILSDSLYYNTGSGWQAITHYDVGTPNIYHYELPQTPNGTTVYYYFAATDNSDAHNRGTYPVNAPDSCFSFKILPTEGVEVLFANPGNSPGYQDYQNIEYPKYIMALDAAGVVYDIYNWAEYDDYSFPESYKAIFVYSNSSSGSSIHDTLSVALMNYMDSGTNENPKNVFLATDGWANSQHPHPPSKRTKKFFTAYMRSGYYPQGTYGYPPYGGTNGLAGPNVWQYSSGSVIGVSGSPIGQQGVELPVYANTPDVLYTRDCPSWYAAQVTNPNITSYSTFLFEDGPGPLIPGQAYCYHGVCALWLDNLIYKSFYTSFDISQFTDDNDIKMIIADALEWFGIDASVKIDLKAFLDGPFDVTDMNTYLNPADLPLSQPYNISPWNYLGTESVIAMPNANVVDWVLVELRDTTDAASATGTTIAAQQAAFVLNDGTITGIDGSSELIFNITIDENLFAVIWHRNHLGVLSANPLVETGGVYTYDFTTGAGQAYGGANGHKEIVTGVWGMFGGDGNADKQISNSDKVDVWEIQAGSSGYLPGDFSLDGQCNNTDKVEVWAPNTGKSSQVPE
ncbi:MAG: choice-of-anchor J domain-containing protein [Bacteroidales bacterium]|nr:choice-of-anchor J domain-containing protein [Bacteroidales bacterium]